MCANGRQANQVCLFGSTASLFDVALADARTASWVSTTPLGCREVPDVATTERVALLDRDATGQRMLLAVRRDDPRGAERIDDDPSRLGGKPGIEGCGSVPGVPNGLERVDEPSSAG